MIFGVLQQLRLIQQSEKHLVLREFPLFEYLIIVALLLGAGNMALFSLWATAIGAIGIALIFALLTRMRDIDFDGEADVMRIVFRYPLRSRIINEMPLEQIERAYLRHDDNDYTQIILVTTQGETGLSVYSRDLRPWKETLVIAINAFLHDARQRRADQIKTKTPLGDA
jgi:hypothetical protein